MNDPYSRPADKDLSQLMHCRNSRVYKRALKDRKDCLLMEGKSLEETTAAASKFAQEEHGKVGVARTVCKREEGDDETVEDIW